MKKNVLLISALFVLMCGSVGAQDVVQDGDAVMSEVGFFPDRGYYGASDTIAVGSVVKITNKSNNKSVEVYLVEKADSFMVLSYDAAFKIGLKRKSTVPVTVEIVKSGSMIKSNKVAGASPKPDKITPVAKKSYQLLPDGVTVPASESAPVVAATETVSVAPVQRNDVRLKVVKDKVVAVIMSEGADTFAAKHISANTNGKSLPKPSDTFYVQIGLFSRLDNAKLVAYTVKTDLPVLIVCKKMETYMGYRVLVGPAELPKKDDILAKLRSSGFDSAFAIVNE